MSTEYAKFLTTNSESEKVVKLTEAVDTVKLKTHSALDDAKAATKKSDVAASKYADLVKEMGILSRKQGEAFGGQKVTNGITSMFGGGFSPQTGGD